MHVNYQLPTGVGVGSVFPILSYGWRLSLKSLPQSVTETGRDVLRPTHKVGSSGGALVVIRNLRLVGIRSARPMRSDIGTDICKELPMESAGREPSHVSPPPSAMLRKFRAQILPPTQKKISGIRLRASIRRSDPHRGRPGEAI